MNAFFLIIFLLIGLVVGGFLGVLWNKGKTNQEKSNLELELQKKQSELDQSNGSVLALTSQLSEEKLKSTNNEKIQNELNNMQKLVTDLKNEAAGADRRRIEAEAQLKEQLTSMNTNSQNLFAQSQAIAGALSSSQTRGKFGEAQLEKLLESAGLVEGINFSLQQNLSNDEKLLGRPDVTIYMPDRREIYIDSKFPFQRYYEAFETDDEATREELLKEHTKDLLKHCEELAKRKYTSSGQSPDFVLVFAPVDTILTAALKSDPAFIDKSFKVGVTIATPTSLFAILRTVGDVLSRHKVAQGAAEIQSIASKFLSDLTSLYEKIRVVGDRISSTVKAYNEMIPTAQTTVLRNVRQMQKLQIPGGPDKEIKEIEGMPKELKSKITNSELNQEQFEITDLEVLESSEDE